MPEEEDIQRGRYLAMVHVCGNNSALLLAARWLYPDAHHACQWPERVQHAYATAVNDMAPWEWRWRAWMSLSNR
jgi:hypothetical protein